MALTDTLKQVRDFATKVSANPEQYIPVLTQGETALKDTLALVQKLKGGQAADVIDALTPYDDVNELLADSKAMDTENAKGPGTTVKEVAEDALEVLKVIGAGAEIAMTVGPLFGLP